MSSCNSSTQEESRKNVSSRQLWITHVSPAAARMNKDFLQQDDAFWTESAAIDIGTRKMLAELAVNDAEGFKALAEIAKKRSHK